MLVNDKGPKCPVRRPIYFQYRGQYSLVDDPTSVACAGEKTQGGVRHAQCIKLSLCKTEPRKVSCFEDGSPILLGEFRTTGIPNGE